MSSDVGGRSQKQEPFKRHVPSGVAARNHCASGNSPPMELQYSAAASYVRGTGDDCSHSWTGLAGSRAGLPCRSIVHHASRPHGVSVSTNGRQPPSGTDGSRAVGGGAVVFIAVVFPVVEPNVGGFVVDAVEVADEVADDVKVFVVADVTVSVVAVVVLVVEAVVVVVAVVVLVMLSVGVVVAVLVAVRVAVVWVTVEERGHEAFELISRHTHFSATHLNAIA